MSKLNI